MNYFENELDGMKRKYQNNGKIQEEVEYSRGVQDGIYRFYDDQGNMTLDYLYKNGEKVSGGIVEPPVKEGEN
jgi:antitoxin component YwqK of YwqJK toxin-antitoxin module